MFSFQNLNCKSTAYIPCTRVWKMCHMSKLRSSINDVINQNRGSRSLICAYCLSSGFITWKKIFDRQKGYLMVSERPIRRKPCSHANNFESLIAFRNTGEEAEMGEGGIGEGFSSSVDATCLQWFYFFFFFFVFFPSRLSYFSLSISLSLSLSHHNQGKNKTKQKKNACTRTPKFLCIVLRNARLPTFPPSPPPPPHVSTHKW